MKLSCGGKMSSRTILKFNPIQQNFLMDKRWRVDGFNLIYYGL
jgi:hypothetical protein